MAKGGSFERWFCDQLSEWWTGAKDDSVFWRTSNSGGRATVRGRKGKKTQGHAGDVGATHPEGEPLMRFVTFELKRGYSNRSPFDLLDRNPAVYNKQVWEDWINQARAAHQRAGSEYWMIVQKRDKREPFCVFPRRMWKVLLTDDNDYRPPLFAFVKLIDSTRQPYGLNIVGMPLSDFFETVDCDRIRDLVDFYSKV